MKCVHGQASAVVGAAMEPGTSSLRLKLSKATQAGRPMPTSISVSGFGKDAAVVGCVV
jgi:hypothetical protein